MIPTTLPDVPLPLAVRRVLAQGLVKDAAGQRFLGSPSALAVLNRNSPPDCNGNGVQDYIDVIEGLAPDVNHNLIPDTCPGG